MKTVSGRRLGASRKETDVIMEARQTDVLQAWNLAKPPFAHSMRYSTDAECAAAGVKARRAAPHQNPLLGKRRYFCDDCNSGPREMQSLHASLCKAPAQAEAAKAHGVTEIGGPARRKLVSAAYQVIVKEFNSAAKAKHRRIAKCQNFVRDAEGWAGSAALQY